jgi:hypothetical protein
MWLLPIDDFPPDPAPGLCCQHNKYQKSVQADIRHIFFMQVKRKIE